MNCKDCHQVICANCAKEIDIVAQLGGPCPDYVGPLKDSGERTEFPSGAVRDMHEGKGRFDLLPMCVLMRLARHYEAGAKKYSDRNWEKGPEYDIRPPGAEKIKQSGQKTRIKNRIE